MNANPEPLVTAPLVTVIIATYQSATTLKCALRSVLAQTFTNFEVWVIGDACTDHSEQVVMAFQDPRVHWYNRSINSRSQSAPNNDGLERARGQYIAYIGHDDLWFRWHLEGMVKTIEDTGAFLVHALMINLGPNGVLGVAGVPCVGWDYDSQLAPPAGWLHRKDDQRWPLEGALVCAPDRDFQRHAFRSGKAIVLYADTSVLKFTSSTWRAYSRTSGHPQPAMLQRMQTDPHGLQRQLLLQVSLLQAREHAAIRPIWRLLRSQAYRRLVVGIYSMAGASTDMDWRTRFARSFFQYFRRKARPLRGLTN